MAPIKFEEQIRDKLVQRTIQPSNDAWAQLSEKLNINEKKKSKRLFFYVGIAASIVGVLLMSNVIFNASESQTIVPNVVDVHENESKNPSINTEIENTTINTVAVTVSEDENLVKNQKEDVPHITSTNNESSVTIVSEESFQKENETKSNLPSKNQKTLISEHAVASVAVKKPENSQDFIEPANALTFEDVKALQVIAEIKKLEIKNGSVTDIEIENLLKQAEKEILRNKIFNETTRTVDANALLQDVEQDLEQSFRSKVFESLKSKFKTVKTAVAERNH